MFKNVVFTSQTVIIVFDITIYYFKSKITIFIIFFVNCSHGSSGREMANGG